MAQALSVHARTKHNKHQDDASAIVSYPRTVVPVNRTRLTQAHVYRCCFKLVMYMVEAYTKEITIYSFLKLLIIAFHNKKYGC